MHQGLKIYSEFLIRRDQEELRDELRNLLSGNPFYRPVMPKTGRPLSVRMTNLGRLGWISDIKGYRYITTHPLTHRPWPHIPTSLLAIWDKVTQGEAPPDACLVNFYSADAKMGLHVDNDEDDKTAPVVSISLGDTARFRIGGTKRTDPTKSFKLSSGDVVVLSGDARFIYHGVDRIYPGTSTLLSDGGRINLTLRRVKQPVP